MREIKFRGKRKDNGEWIYGDLVHNAFDGTCRTIPIGIQPDHCYPIEVDPETIGQFTGPLDKNGKDIWEGDIFIVKHVHDGDEYIWEYGKPIPQTVTWDKVGFEFGDSTRIVYAPYDFEVIGNIYEAEQDEEEYTCPIHGKCEGGECPRC